MSLANVKDTVAYSSTLDIDKIVRIFTGSYDSTQPTTRVGSLATAYVYTIPHGLTRPVFCELLWSTDNLSFTDGGTSNGTDSKLAFADSTNIYIFDGYAPSGTVYYKIYCSWIDDYDATNPSVEVELYDDTNIQFDSRLNYQKIYDKDELSFSPGTFGTTETQSVAHSLGYAPNAKVWFEAFSGEVWPLNAGGASNFFDYDGSQDECSISITTTTLDISMDKFSNTQKRLWYKIYYDAT